MSAVLLTLHSLLRWAVLLLLVGRAGRSLTGWLQRTPWVGADRTLGLVTLICVDVQLLVGLVLYGMYSPAVQAAQADPGAAMADPALRFWFVEHASIMILAVVAAHIGQVMAKRGKTDLLQHRAARCSGRIVSGGGPSARSSTGSLVRSA